VASTLPYINREELDELEQELRSTKPGYSPDLDAFQCTILLDLILAFRQGQIVGCPPPAPGVARAPSGREAALREAWAAIDRCIVRGELPGNGTDKTAERNGLVLACNIVTEMIGADGAPAAQPQQENKHG
jgi:hypothetical protein